FDYDAAARAARDGLRGAPANSYARPGLQLILAAVLTFQGQAVAARPLIEDAITSSMLQETPDLEITGWQMLGVNRLRAGDLAGDLHAATNDFRFVLSSWEAAEGNRSSSLREAIAASSGWRSRLPNAYWFKLAAFRQQLVERSRSAGGETARGTGELESELMRMEMEAGLADT